MNEKIMKTYNIRLEMEVEIKVDANVTIEQAELRALYEIGCTGGIRSTLHKKLISIDTKDCKIKK